MFKQKNVILIPTTIPYRRYGKMSVIFLVYQNKTALERPRVELGLGEN